MTFREPLALLGLVLLPLAAAAYVALQHTRRREAARWASPGLLPGLLTASPGWRRHIPPALALLAIGALVVALARPQRSVAAPQRAATVMMVTDTSASMEATDVAPTRLEAAIKAAKTLTDKLPRQFRLGLVTFSDGAEQRAAPTTDRAPVKAALETLVAEGGTAMGDGMARALDAARTPVPALGGGRRRLPSVLVLLSDGKRTAGLEDPEAVALRARKLHVRIHTIALGTDEGVVDQPGPLGFPQSIPVPPDKETLRAIARITGGRFFEAPSADELKQIYERLGTQVSARREKREITSAFAGGAILFLLLGGALGLRWFGRVPS